MRKLTLEGKITIFKSLAISKIVYLALLTTIPNSVIEELKQIHKMFLWGNKKPKIKHDTSCNKYKDAGLKKCRHSSQSSQFKTLLGKNAM